MELKHTNVNDEIVCHDPCHNLGWINALIDERNDDCVMTFVMTFDG